jgi:hypothetical protein
MASGKELQIDAGRVVSAEATVPIQPAKPAFIDAEYTEVKPAAEASKPAEAEPRAPKIGEGAFAAWLRAGLKELAQALPAFPDSTIRPVEEPGAFGNVTPQIVTDQMGHCDYDVSWAAQRAQFKSQDKEQDLGR